jgi:hypothetical protein
MDSRKPSINYLIATYAGVSSKREEGDKGITPFILQLHLKQLIELLPSCSMIKQVTIMRPSVEDNDSYDEYYNIQTYVDDIEERFGIPVRFVDMQNYKSGVSYSQYRQAFEVYPDFDLYMLMEDDWVPMQERFDQLLMTEWYTHFASPCDNAFLCMWITSSRKYKPHAAISVGLVSNVALKALKSRFDISVELDQYRFSLGLEVVGTTIKDYSTDTNWRILFWESGKSCIYDFSPSRSNQQTLLAPLHFLLKDEYNFTILPR